jgi:serine/threonine-protein kinase
VEELGRDGDGVVYKARDPRLDRLVAITTVARSADGTPANPQFERKVRLAGALAHPNIVSVYDAASIRDLAYIATELVEGRTLREMLDAGVALSPAAIERIAAQVADGLDFMHRHAIVHGDVSPSTVVVLDIGFVKLSYAGNALYPMGSSIPADNLRAASSYVSPEHVTAMPVDARSDVFSLGAVLYEMLTGVAPFGGSTPHEVAHAITTRHPAPPSSLNPGIPSGFDYVVAKALAKEPDHRYQSARDMASHLRQWALEEPTFFTVPRSAAMPAWTPESPPPEEQANLRARRQWLLYGASGALLALTAAWTLRSRPTQKPGAALATMVPVPTPKAVKAEPGHVVEKPAPAAEHADDEPVGPATVASTSPRTEPQPAARLKLAVSPWGEIYVDGRRSGVSPPMRHIDLTPGRHQIEIRNTNFPPRTEYLEVKANAQVRIKHKFA